MKNEETNYNANTTKKGSKVGSFVAGGIVGAAVAGGVANATPENIEMVKDFISDLAENNPLTADAQPAEHEAPKENAAAENVEEVATENVEEIATENIEEVAELAEDAPVETDDRLERLEAYIEERNNEHLQAMDGVEEQVEDAPVETDDRLERLEAYIEERNNENIQTANEAEVTESIEAEEVAEVADAIEADSIEVAEDAPAELAEETINVAEGISDDLSFGEAFAAARAQVGAGGAFEWNGKMYNTYTAEEWDSMSAEEKSDFHDKIFANDQLTEEQLGEIALEENNDEIILEPAEEEAEALLAETTEENTEDLIVEVADENSSIEVVGIEHNDEHGLDISTININDQEIVLVNLEGDGGNFDVALIDADGDGLISDDEIFVISDSGAELYANDSMDDANLDLFTDNDMPDDDMNDFDMNLEV